MYKNRSLFGNEAFDELRSGIIGPAIWSDLSKISRVFVPGGWSPENLLSLDALREIKEISQASLVAIMIDKITPFYINAFFWKMLGVSFEYRAKNPSHFFRYFEVPVRGYGVFSISTADSGCYKEENVIENTIPVGVCVAINAIDFLITETFSLFPGHIKCVCPYEGEVYVAGNNTTGKIEILKEKPFNSKTVCIKLL